MMLMNAHHKDIHLQENFKMDGASILKMETSNTWMQISHVIILIRKFNVLLFALAEIPKELSKKVIEI